MFQFSSPEITNTRHSYTNGDERTHQIDMNLIADSFLLNLYFVIFNSKISLFFVSVLNSNKLVFHVSALLLPPRKVLPCYLRVVEVLELSLTMIKAIMWLRLRLSEVVRDQLEIMVEVIRLRPPSDYNAHNITMSSQHGIKISINI